MKKIAIVVSYPGTVKSLAEQIDALSRAFHVSVVLNLPARDGIPYLNPGVEVVAAPIVRDISLLKDLQGLIFLVALFSRQRFDAVHSFTPKAGLLAALSGMIARVPVRIHTFTGQVWATRAGLARRVLKTADSVIARLTTHILVDSPSQRDFLIHERVLSRKKSRVLANGSLWGVNVSRFRPDPEWRAKIRQLHGIPEEAILFIFIGRLKLDKGVLDLANAFSQVAGRCCRAWLLFVGPDEERLSPVIEAACSAVASRLRLVGSTDVSEEYMAAADVLCLPSYREGFGSVIIEAASAGIPSIASNIYGITDAIESGKTGLLHPAGDVESLRREMQKMIDDPGMRNDLGQKARLRAHRLFDRDLVTSALVEFYDSVVG